MTSNAQSELASRVLDVTARGLDLIAVVAKISTGTDASSNVAKEVGRWLGREGLDEHELQHFLESARALARPNSQPKVGKFLDAITDRRPKQSAVVPFWAQPSGALGRLVASDPLQRWLTTTVCALFRYHDERFIRFTLTSFIMLTRRPGQKPLSEYQLAYDPEMFRLEPVVSKIVHSSWVHIANAGIIGSDSECPRLPAELSWSCKRGHNIGSYKLALVLNRLRDPPKEVIFQSERLLTNLVLWLTWHFDGRLRVVVSGNIVYDRILGPADSTVECRVGKFCPKDEDAECTSSEMDPVPSFQMFGRVEGDLKSLFRGQYDSQQTLMSEPRVRQKLYQSPFRYPKGAQKSLEIQTQRTAQELLRWFCGLPVEKDDMSSRLSFRVLLDSSLDWRGLRVADLLGRTPQLLNTYCGELGRPSVVFSPPRQSTPPTVDNFMDIDDLEDDDEDGEVDFEDKPQVLIKYFPILQDLVEQGRVVCKCFYCTKEKGQSLLWDENCVRHKTFVEVMFYFSHGIADAFGAPDASGCSDTLAGDSGAMEILLDAINMACVDPGTLEGKVDWHTLLNTTCQIFLGCPTLDTMTDATYNDSAMDTPHPFMQNLGATIVAVQHGDLAVVAPWLDLSQRIDLRRCLRWEVVKGRLEIPVDEVSGRMVLQEVARDTSVIETQHTEDVSDYAEMFRMPSHPAGTDIQLGKDKSEETCDFFLVSSGEKYKLLMRVTSGAHSRMVDPSRAIIKMANEIHTLQCNHDASKIGTVPEGHPVELYRFDELLGRWGAVEARERDPEEQGEDGPSSAKALPSQQSPPTHQRNPHKRKNLGVTHVLNSLFKFNTALALSGDNPVFVGSGSVCLNCALEKATGLELPDFYKDYQRWIINRDPYPSSKVPRNRFHLKASEARLIRA